MATAHIIFQQNGDGYTTPGSRDDLALGLAVTMLNQNNTGVVSWAWIMIDKPTGSSASIANPTASTTTFTPDVVGTYLIHLAVNAGAATDQKGAAVKTANFQYRIPAATETIEFDGYRGWATATNKALKTIDDGYIPPSAIPSFQSVYNTSNPASFIINGTNGGFQVRDASSATGFNLFEVDAYSVGTKYFIVAAAGTSVNTKFVVTGSNFIGVNTATPLYPVHVTTAADNYSFVQTRGAVSGGLYARTTSTQGFGLGTVSNDPLLFFTNNTPGTPSMFIGTSGAIGIGTVSPTSQLHVIGTGHFTGTLTLDNGFSSGAAATMGGFKITSLATPTTGTDAATKAYVDSQVSATTATLQTAYAASIPATVQLNQTSGAIILQDAQAHLGGGQTALFKIDAYNSASNYMTIYRAGEELNRESGSTALQSTGASLGVIYDAIWGSGSTDIYAVGYDSSGSKQQLARYNGTSWSVLTYPGSVGDTVGTVFGFAANDVYIGTTATGGGPGGIWHSTNSGTSWTQQYSTKGINTIWGPDATHIYAGVQDNSGVILSSNGGGTWSAVGGSVGSRFINSIWGANSTEFWVATSDSIYHTSNSGASFASQFNTSSNSTGFISIGVAVNWKSVWGTSSSNVYAVGTANSQGFIAHYNGSFWSLQLQNYADAANIGFTDIYGTSVNDIYVCGGQTLLYSNGNGAWIPQQLGASVLGGSVTLNAAFAPAYNQWFVATSATNPVSMISLAPQGANITAPGIATLGAVVTNNITTPDTGLNVANPLTFTAFVDSDAATSDAGFIFNTTGAVPTSSTNYLAAFQSGGTNVFKIKGDGYLHVPSTGGFRQLGTSTDIFGWTSSAIIASEAVQINNTLNTTGLATFGSHISVDGYTFNLSAGVTSGQTLVYNGTSFVPQSQGVVEVANVFDTQLVTTSPTNVVTFTPLANGNFVCYIYYRVITASTDVTIEMDWTDQGGAQTLTVLSTTTKTVGSYSVAAIYIQAKATFAINVLFTAGTANQVFVSSTITSV